MNGNIKLFFTKIIATFFYTGLFPKAPGTAGSFFAVIFYLALAHFLNRYDMVIITVIIFFIGWLSCVYIVQITGDKDPQTIVIDEVVGIFITMTMVPIVYMDYPYNIFYSLLCFILFRLFDITKPFPVSWADSKVKGGLGVMLDDVFAGVLAGFTIWTGIAIYKNFSL